ncbi:probable E3 ubiquitin-protein ligase ARI8 [Etheostoma spectabile]|uniref:probable E3 ubiquitin-protein ligase ARI8 n=1 Tax=Etheostoma spectabile TaxID=54343 RepID=UPI0013AF8126|nr:probable E3 ubiquitin-protein ligase ARI8 [Etheostoma spectabile]
MGSKSTKSEESCNDQQPSRHVTTESRRSEDFLEERILFNHNMTVLDRLIMSTWKPEERSDSEEESSLKFVEWRNSEETSKGTTEEQKCYDPLDATLKFVDGDDDLDFLCENFKGRRAKMSCGHAVTPMSLTKWCRRLLDEGKSRFECGCCKGNWPFEEVCKMALLTPEEIDYFEKKMFSNARGNLNFKTCPGCQSYVVRTDLDNLNVRCLVCKANKGRTYMFCWQCLREWKGPYPRSDQCENDGCPSQLEILRTCPDITFEMVKNVTGCPTIRACPTCGYLLEHNKTKCKNITCPQCKVEFCFVCLRLTVECKTLFNACSTGVAQRQTSIPVWKRK